MGMGYSMEELLPVLEKQIRRYTLYDSTSVSYDKARQLMGSIIYCINGLFDDEKAMIPYEGMNPQTAFELGLKKRKNKLQRAKALYLEIQKDFCFYGNRCYMETVIKGMKAFFDLYSLEYDALNAIITLDYPLIDDRIRLQGIDLIYEYLRKIQLEQLFLSRLNPESMESMLCAYDAEYRDNIFNVCSIALRSSLAMLLSGLDPFIPITEKALEYIKQRLCGKSSIQLEKELNEKLKYLIEKEYYNNSDLYDYLQKDIKELSLELEQAMELGCLERVLPVYILKENAVEWYEDGICMTDEALRRLIEEMKRCRYTEDKLSMVKQGVTSLEDLKEIMEECFRSDEYEAVLSIVSPQEMKKLKEEILLKKLFDEQLKEWEQYILR